LQNDKLVQKKAKIWRLRNKLEGMKVLTSGKLRNEQ